MKGTEDDLLCPFLCVITNTEVPMFTAVFDNVEILSFSVCDDFSKQMTSEESMLYFLVYFSLNT